MKRLGFALLLGFGSLGIGTIFTGCHDKASSGGSTNAAAEAKYRLAPDFELKDSSGKTHQLSEFRGNAVLVHFWASWCPPCLEEISNWVKFSEQFSGKHVKFVAISLDDNWEAAQKILPTKNLPAGVVSLLDLTKQVPDRFGTYQYPETYLLSPSLHIITKWVGGQSWENPKLRDLIEQVAEKGAAAAGG